jgi:hypothetical protein
MEFLRFGSSIPGSYWGCCAMCIIQNFNFDPDEKASIQLVDGDGGHPITDTQGRFLFAGPTYKDIFLQRLRIGTFSKKDMPDHGFLAILTEWQIRNNPGRKWLQILKEQGFEFIRTVDNSVYSGGGLSPGSRSSKPNYLFGLFRNIGSGAINNPFVPPKEWSDLEQVVPEAWQFLDENASDVLTHNQQAGHTKLYNNLPKNKWMTESELEETNTPITFAGERSEYPQESKQTRLAKKKGAQSVANSAKPAPFAATV